MTSATPQPIWKTWFVGKELTKDMLGRKLHSWIEPLAPFCDKRCNVLEVGTYEGRSAIAFLEYLPKSRLTAIDIFTIPEVEARFDFNMRQYGDRVTKIKDRAIPTMDRMLSEKMRFDLIYLDTGKHRAAAFAQSGLAWGLLEIGGILIWDDLLWGQDRRESNRPAPGIRLFANTFSECMETLHEHRQLIVKKTAEWPSVS